LLKKAPEDRAEERLLSLPVPAPVQPKAAAPVPAPRQEAPAKPERFLVQLVSYQEKSKAEALVRKITAMGKPARLETTELPDKGTWHRVVMGEFAGRQEAQEAIDAVSRKIKGLNGVIRSVE
jgi:cell division septation protein DedD